MPFLVIYGEISSSEMPDTGIPGLVNGSDEVVFVANRFNYVGYGPSIVARVPEYENYVCQVWVGSRTFTVTCPRHPTLPFSSISPSVAFIMPDGFITDRTQADVDYAKRIGAKARAEKAEDLKGTLNTSDWERLFNNIYIALLMCKNQTSQPTQLIGNIPEFPNSDNLSDLISNIDYVAADCYHTHSRLDYHEDDYNYLWFEELNTFDVWNDMELLLYQNFDICTTRWEYFAEHNNPFSENIPEVGNLTDYNVDNYNLFWYIGGEKYKLDFNNAFDYLPISAINSPTGIKSISQAINELREIMTEESED